MKKLSFVLLLLAATLSLSAQDVIYKLSGDSILAKVEAVTDEAITYHRFDNPAGPVYTISVQNVASIRYANGVVEKYTAANSSLQYRSNAAMASAPAQNVQNVPQEKSNVTYNVSVNKNDPATRSDYQKALTRSGNTYFYGGNAMDKKAYIRFLEANCPAAWQKANTGYKTATAGWCLLGIGAAFEVGGVIGVIATAGNMVNNDSADPYATTNSVLGLSALYYIGGVSILASIPTICVGYAKMHNSVDVYNVSCTTAQARPYWSVQTSRNGVGLAYNF